MKKRLLIIAATATLAIAALVSVAVADSLRPTVIYDGSTHTFSYRNTDASGLFADFQDLMPGDDRTTDIRFELKNIDHTVRAYLRAEPEEGDRAALEPLVLGISRNGILIDRQTGMNSLSRNTLLGTFSRADSVRLDVSLSVPTSVGNEVADHTGILNWIFTVQEDGVGGSDGSDAQSPHRGLLNDRDHFAYIIGFEDGKVHPERELTRGEAATLFFRLLNDDTRNLYLCTWNPFEDISESDWCNTAISTLYNLGVVYGRKNNVFDRDALITRAEFSAMAARFSNSEYHGDKKFSDISGHWAENEIYRAAEQDWVRGFPDGTFRPERKITRAEAMVIINRVLRRVPASKDDLLADMIVWPDNMDTAAWYYLDIQEATNSHDFMKRADGSEKWTALTPARDWKQYET